MASGGNTELSVERAKRSQGFQTPESYHDPTSSCAYCTCLYARAKRKLVAHARHNHALRKHSTDISRSARPDTRTQKAPKTSISQGVPPSHNVSGNRKHSNSAIWGTRVR